MDRKDSAAYRRLCKLYGLVLRRLAWLNSEFGQMAARLTKPSLAPAAMETLEPRVLLSGMSVQVDDGVPIAGTDLVSYKVHLISDNAHDAPAAWDGAFSGPMHQKWRWTSTPSMDNLPSASRAKDTHFLFYSSAVTSVGAMDEDIVGQTLVEIDPDGIPDSDDEYMAYTIPEGTGSYLSAAIAFKSQVMDLALAQIVVEQGQTVTMTGKAADGYGDAIETNITIGESESSNQSSQNQNSHSTNQSINNSQTNTTQSLPTTGVWSQSWNQKQYLLGVESDEASPVTTLDSGDISFGPIQLNALASMMDSYQQEYRTLYPGDSNFNSNFDSFRNNKVGARDGDANMDGVVDVIDLGILAKNYDRITGCAWSTADFTGDGKVDVVDLGVLAKNYDPSASPLPSKVQATTIEYTTGSQDIDRAVECSIDGSGDSFGLIARGTFGTSTSILSSDSYLHADLTGGAHPTLTLWEQDGGGDPKKLATMKLPGASPSGIYYMRLVTTDDPANNVKAQVWAEGQTEPAEWLVATTTLDGTHSGMYFSSSSAAETHAFQVISEVTNPVVNTTWKSDTNYGNSTPPAAPGLLDVTHEPWQAIAVQPDGKVLVANACHVDSFNGQPLSGTDLNCVRITRYNANGTVDKGFGPDNNGVATLIPDNGTDNFRSVRLLVQGGYGIVIAANGADSAQNDTTVLAGLYKGGTVDPNFGTGGVAHCGSDIATLTAASIDSDDNILLTGSTTEEEPIVVRLYSDGSCGQTWLNATAVGGYYGYGYDNLAIVGGGSGSGSQIQWLNNGGTVLASVTWPQTTGGIIWIPVQLVMTNDETGDVLALCSDPTATAGAMKVFRYHLDQVASPDPDPYLATLVYQTVEYPATPSSLVVGSDDSFTVDATDGGGRAVLLGYTSSGAAVAGPYVLQSPWQGTSSTMVQGIALSASGGDVVVAALNTTSGEFVAARGVLGTSWEPDTSYGQKATPGQFDVIAPSRAIAVQPDGKVLAADAFHVGSYNGLSLSGDANCVYLKRYNINGTVDSGFGSDGVAIGIPNSATYNVSSMQLLVQSDGKIVVAACDVYNHKFAVSRFNADGSPDQYFGDGGVARCGSEVATLTAASIDSDGDILLTGNNGTNPIVVRLTNDGRPDGNFGTLGQSSLSLGWDMTAVAGYGSGNVERTVVGMNSSAGSQIQWLNNGGTVLASVTWPQTTGGIIWKPVQLVMTNDGSNDVLALCSHGTAGATTMTVFRCHLVETGSSATASLASFGGAHGTAVCTATPSSLVVQSDGSFVVDATDETGKRVLLGYTAAGCVDNNFVHEGVTSSTPGVYALPTKLTLGTVWGIALSDDGCGVAVAAADTASREIAATRIIVSPPAAPTGLTLTGVSSSEIDLTWLRPLGPVSSYTILRRRADDVETQVIATGVTATVFADTTLTGGTQYFYEIQAVNRGGPGDASDESSAYTAPLTPTGLTVTPIVVSGQSLQVSLQWNKANNATDYRVEREDLSQSTPSWGLVHIVHVDTVQNTYDYPDTSISSSDIYAYRIIALNGSACSLPSNPVTVAFSPAVSAIGINPTSVKAGASMTLSAAVTPAVAGDDLDYEWSFTSGSYTDTETSDSPILSYTPTVGGSWTVSLTVTETHRDNGAIVWSTTTTADKSFDVAAISITGPSQGIEGQPATYQAVCEDSFGAIHWTATWSGSPMTPERSWTGGSSFDFTPAHSGDYTVVAANTTSSKSATMHVAVTQDAPAVAISPTVSISGPAVGFAGKQQTFTAHVSQPAETSGAMTYSWTLLNANGSLLNADGLPHTGSGSPCLSHQSTLTIPDTLPAGSYQVQLSVTDGAGAIASQTFATSVLDDSLWTGQGGTFEWGGATPLGLTADWKDSKYYSITAMIQQQDGKVLVAVQMGTQFSSGGLYLARFNADLTLDTSFGPDQTGVAPVYLAENISTTSSLASNIAALAINPVNQDIVVVGDVYDAKYMYDWTKPGSWGAKVAVAEYVSQPRVGSNGQMLLPGMPDPAFHGGHPFILEAHDYSSSSDSISSGTAVVAQADGSLLVGGMRLTPEKHNGFDDYDFILLKLTADGQLDPHFGTNGIAAKPNLTPNGVPASSGSYANAFGKIQTLLVYPQSDPNDAGKILAGGYATSANGSVGFALVRWIGTGNDAGTLDPSFSGGSTFTGESDLTTDERAGDAWLCDMTVLSGGTISVAGTVGTRPTNESPLGDYDNNGYNRVVLAKYKPDGTLGTASNTVGAPVLTGLYDVGSFSYINNDDTFDLRGKDRNSYHAAFGFDSSGRLVISGFVGKPAEMPTTQGSAYGSIPWRVFRLATNGSLDTTFGAIANGTRTGEIDVPSPATGWRFGPSVPSSLVVAEDGSILLPGSNLADALDVYPGDGSFPRKAPITPLLVRYSTSQALSAAPKVTGLEAVAAPDGTVALTWTNSGYGQDAFEIRRATSSTGLNSSDTVIGTVGPNQYDFVDDFNDLKAAHSQDPSNPNYDYRDKTFYYRITPLVGNVSGHAADAQVHAFPDGSWQLQQNEIAVTNNGEVEVTLAGNQTYLLEVTGTVNIADGYAADAGHWYCDANHGESLSASGVRCGLGISVSDSEAIAVPTWGVFDSINHTYTIPVTGTGKQLKMQFQGTMVAGSSTLEVHIYDPEAEYPEVPLAEIPVNNGEVVDSGSLTLDGGKTYLVKVTGWVGIGNGYVADAEYWYSAVDSTEHGAPLTRIRCGLGISVSDSEAIAVPTWGAFNSDSHTYSIAVTGTGDQLRMRFQGAAVTAVADRKLSVKIYNASNAQVGPTLYVADGNEVDSSSWGVTLNNHQTYTVVVADSVDIGSGYKADAGYWYTGENPKKQGESLDRYGLGISVSSDAITVPAWGAFDSDNHTYTIQVDGQNAPLRMQFEGSDVTGLNLTVHIYDASTNIQIGDSLSVTGGNVVESSVPLANGQYRVEVSGSGSIAGGSRVDAGYWYSSTNASDYGRLLDLRCGLGINVSDSRIISDSPITVPAWGLFDPVSHTYTIAAVVGPAGATLKMQFLGAAVTGSLGVRIYADATPATTPADNDTVMRITSFVPPGIGREVVIDRATPVSVIAAAPTGASTPWSLWLVGSGTPTRLAGGDNSAVAAPNSPDFAGMAPNRPAAVAMIDPARYADGKYSLELVPSSDTYNVNNVAYRLDVLIESAFKSGNLTLPVTDATINTPVGPISITRTYDSARAGQMGDLSLGYGWTLSTLDTQLRTTAQADTYNPSPATSSLRQGGTLRAGDLVYLTVPNDGQHVFEFAPVAMVESMKYAGGVTGVEYEPRFVALDGSGAVLTLRPDILNPIPLGYDQVDDEYVMIMRSNVGADELEDDIGFNPARELPWFVRNDFWGIDYAQYCLTTKDGTSYTINAGTGMIESVTATNGNEVDYVDNGSSVTAELKTGPRTRQTLFTILKDTHGRVTEVNTGQKSIVYSYDDIPNGPLGNLVNVKDQTDQHTKYCYQDSSNKHLLTAIVGPDQRTLLQVQYDHATGQLAALVNASGITVPVTSAALGNGQVVDTIVDAAGDVTENVYDETYGTLLRKIQKATDGKGTDCYIVTLTNYSYVIDDSAGMSALRPSGVRMLQSVEQYAPFEIAGSDSDGLRYSAQPKFWNTQTVFSTTDNLDDSSIGQVSSRSVRLTDGETPTYQITRYGNYVFTTLGPSPQTQTVLVHVYESGGYVDHVQSKTYTTYDASGNTLYSLAVVDSDLNKTGAIHGQGIQNIYTTDIRFTFGVPDPCHVYRDDLPAGLLLTTQAITATAQIKDDGTVDVGGIAVLATTAQNVYYTYKQVDALYYPSSYVAGAIYGAPRYTIDAQGQETYYAYDQQGHTILEFKYETWTDSKGAPVSGWVGNINVYDARGLLTDTYQATYKDNGSLDSQNSILDTDQHCHILQTAAGGVAGIQVSTWEEVYAAPILVYWSTNPPIRVTHKDYNSNGQLIDTIDQYGGMTQYTYDANRHVIRTVNPDLTETRTVYDELGRAIWTTQRFLSDPHASSPDNTTTTLLTHTIYNQLGQVTATEQYRDGVIEIVSAGLGSVGALESRWSTSTPGTELSFTKTYYNPRGQAIETIAASTAAVTGLRTGTIYYPNGQVQYTGPLNVNAPNGGQPTTLDFTKDDFTYFTQSEYNQYDSTLGLFYNSQTFYNSPTDTAPHTTKTYLDSQGRTVRTVYDDGSFTETLYSVGTQPITKDQEGNPIAVPGDISGALMSTQWVHGRAAGGQEVVSIAQRKFTVSVETVQDGAGPGTNEVQVVRVTGGASGGTFMLAFGDQTTKAIAGNASAEEVRQALQALLNIGTVTVTADHDGGPWTCTFGGTRAGSDVAQMRAVPVITYKLYDKAGKLLDVWQPVVTDGDPRSSTHGQSVNPHWHYTYDTAGNQLSQTDPKGNKTCFGYDQNGNQIRQILPGGQTETWTYSAQGQLLTHVDFKGQTTAYLYDNTAAGQGREVGEYYFGQHVSALGWDGSVCWNQAAQHTTYAYDGMGRQQEVDDVSGTLTRSTTYTYDLVTQQVASVESPEGAIHYEYYPATGLLKRTYTTHSGSQTIWTNTTYDYDPQGRLQTVTVTRLDGQDLADSLVTTYDYDNAGNKWHELLPNGVTTKYTYDDLNRLTDVEEKKAGVVLFTQHYTLNDDGTRARVDETQHQTNETDVTSHTIWTYDALGRLTSETVTVGSTVEYSDTYTYDLAGNRLSKVHDELGVEADEINYVYNSDDELVSQTSTLSGVTTFVYDANGSMTRQTTDGLATTYDYDLRNKMVAVAVGGETTATYAYDDAGNRVAETRYSWVELLTCPPQRVLSVTTTQYLTDTQNPTGYSQPVEEWTEGVSGHPTRTYLIGDRVFGQANLVVGGNEDVTFLLSDGHGSTRLLTSAAGEVTETYNYDAFGGAIGVAGAPAWDPARAGTPFLFGGDAMYDAPSGLYLHGNGIRARLGFFFLQRDPSEINNTQDPLSLHKYLYAYGNPINYTDPSGLFSLGELTAAGSAEGAIDAGGGGASLAMLAYARESLYASSTLYNGITGGIINAGMMTYGDSNVDWGAAFGVGFASGTLTAGLHYYAKLPCWAASGIGGAVLQAGNNYLTEGSGAYSWQGLGEAVAVGVVSGLLGYLMQGGCFTAGTEVLLGDGQTEQAIDQIHVGQRVATDAGVANSLDGQTAASDPNATAVDPATWRLVTIEAGDWEIQALEPISWIESHFVAAGIDIDLSQVVDLVEMGVPAGLVGTVLSVTECPTLEAGPGRVVLTTVSHLNNDVYDLTLQGIDGTLDNLGVTGCHRVYTEDRGWVEADELAIGEVVRTAHGDVTVASLDRDPGVFRVYNMTVEADHDYFVGDLTALVHNMCALGDAPPFKGRDANRETLRAVRDIAKKLHLTPDQVEVLHELITGERNGYKEILDIAKNYFNK